MSVRKVSSSTTSYTTGLGTKVTGSIPTTPWVRNKSWLSFTAPTASEEKFIGLFSVWPEANFLALSAAGNYTVNWGDGLIENFASGVTAQHEYDFADVDLANTNAPVTLQGTADTVTRASHGYSNGDTVRLYNIITTTGISANNPYYVVSATTNTFKLSLTLGGSAIDLVNDGSATLLPYKQAIVQVYPQAGQNLTSLRFDIRHSSVTGTSAYTVSFLDIALSGSLLTTFAMGNTLGTAALFLSFGYLEQVNIVRSDLRQLTGVFTACNALSNIVNLETSTSSAANISVTFTDATDLVNATAHGFRNGDSVIFSSITSTTGITTYTKYFVISATANTFQVSLTYGGTAVVLTTNGSGVAVRGTDMTNMFNACYALTSVPLFNTSSVTIMTNMFFVCYALKSVPLFNTAAVTNMSNMFNACASLTSVSLFNTAAVTNMSSMFNACASLTSVPLFNTSAVTDMSSMFNNCTSLTSVPLFNTSAVTSMASTFALCTSLTSVPLFNTAAVTSMSNIFSNCYSLKSVPLFNTAAVTNMTNMFSACYALKSVPLYNTAAVTNMSGMFGGCYSLTSVPLFNTAAVTNMASMFSQSVQLQSIPLFNTAAVLTFTSMFSGCTSLQAVPALNVTAPTGSSGYSSMFNACRNLSRIQASSFRWTVNVSNLKLSATALNEIYTNLPTVTTQTITVTNNYGTATDNPAIATAKGWTVTG